MYKLIFFIKKHRDSIISTLSLILNRGLDSVILLVITPLLIRTLGGDYYGKMMYYLAIIFFIQTFVTFGFENYIIYNISDTKKNSSKVLSLVMNVKFLIFSTLSFFYIIFCFLFYKGELFFPYIFLLLPFTECFNFSHYFVVKGIASKLVVFSIIRLFFYSIFTISFVKNTHDIDLYAFILTFSYLFSVIFQNIFLIFKDGVRVKLFSESKNALGMCFKESGYFFSLKLFQVLSDRMYLIVAGAWIDFFSVSILDVSIKLYSVVIMPIQIIVISILPKFLRKESEFNNKLVFIFVLCIGSFLIPLSILFKENIDLYFFNVKGVTELNIYLLMVISAIFFIFSFLISELYLNPKGKIKYSIYTSSCIFIMAFLFIGINCYFEKISLELLLIIFLFSKIADFVLKLLLFRSLKNM